MAEQDQEQQDVQGDPSIAAAEQAQAAAGAVTASGAEPEVDAQGVPWRNRMAEMERKHEKALEEMRAMYAQAVTSLQQQAPPPQAQRPQQQQYTDEELFALANQGHFVAHQELQQRLIQRQNQTQHRASLSDQHIRALRQLYPDLNNQTSPLFQAANTLYREYIAAGYPATAETQHTAMSTAAAAYARQQAQQQGVGQASEASRQQQIDAHQAVAGTSVPPAGSNRRRPGAVTPEQVELAKKIGAKDPAKALERFRQRAADGRSQYGAGLSSAAERVLP